MNKYRRFNADHIPGKPCLTLLFAMALSLGLLASETHAAPQIPCELLDTCLEDKLLGLSEGDALGLQRERFGLDPAD